MAKINKTDLIKEIRKLDLRIKRTKWSSNKVPLQLEQNKLINKLYNKTN